MLGHNPRPLVEKEPSVKRIGPIPELVRFHGTVQRYRFAALLATLILLFVAIAIVSMVQKPGYRYLAGISIALLFDLVLLSAVNAVCRTRKTMVVAVSIAVPAALVGLASAVTKSIVVHAVSNVLGLTFVALVIVLVLDFLFRSRRVDANMICASLCVYLLMGVAWACLYSLCYVFEENSFVYAYADEVAQASIDNKVAQASIDNKVAQARMFFGDEKSLTPIYYSFVTLTTLGYGDIVPVSPPAKILAILEAVVGQIYLTVLVARLVGLHIAHVTSPPSGSSS